MDASSLIRCSAADGGPQAAGRPSTATPDAQAGPASFLSVLDQAAAAGSPPAETPAAPPARTEAASPPPGKQPADTAQPPDGSRRAPEAAGKQEPAKGEKKPTAKAKGKGGKTDKKDTPHGKSVPQAAQGASADASTKVTQTAAEGSSPPSREKASSADPQASPGRSAPAVTPARTVPPVTAARKANAPPPEVQQAPARKGANGQGSVARQTETARQATVAPTPTRTSAAARTAAVPQLKTVEFNASGDRAAAKKAPMPAQAPAPGAAHARAPRAAAAPVKQASVPASPADPQPLRQRGQGAEHQSAPKEPAPAAAEKTDAPGPRTAHTTSARPVVKAPAAVPLSRAQTAAGTGSAQRQPGAVAVAVQAWRHYDAQAGAGYRQQVQTLAGRTAGQMRAEIIRQAQMVRQNGSTTIRMQLNPPEMGRIRLEVRMKSEHLEVRVQVENPDVRQAMTRELAGLDRTLREAQVDVQRFDVTDYESGRQAPERGGSHDAAPPGGGGPAPAAAGEQDDTALGWARISTSGAVDCLI